MRGRPEGIGMYKKGLNVNANTSKMMVLGVDKGLECEVHVDRVQLEQVSEFRYLGCF